MRQDDELVCSGLYGQVDGAEIAVVGLLVDGLHAFAVLIEGHVDARAQRCDVLWGTGVERYLLKARDAQDEVGRFFGFVFRFVEDCFLARCEQEDGHEGQC